MHFVGALLANASNSGTREMKRKTSTQATSHGNTNEILRVKLRNIILNRLTTTQML